MQAGVVYLVGAGPGDPRLVTVAGAAVLARADCVIYDRLVDRRLLDLAPAHCERLPVGKIPGIGHCQDLQTPINQLLVERARQGKTVVRLKGGDPLLFARGAEEAAALRAAGIKYEIIPGVTAGLAAAATAAIPLTHRMAASAVAFITGHEDPAKSQMLDWSGLAAFPGTLVVYMGLRRLNAYAAELHRKGKDGATPVALVEWAGTNRQKVFETTLARAAEEPLPPLESPVIAIIGDVSRFRRELAWFENRPLWGRRILTLRAPGQASEIALRLEELGATVENVPAFKIEAPNDFAPVDAAIDRLGDYDWLVFSSSNGVDRFLARLIELGKDLRAIGRAKLAAIGPGTAATLQRWHLRADLVPDEYRAEALAADLAGEVKSRRVLLVRADRGRRVLEEELSKAAAEVKAIVAYRQVDSEAPPELLAKIKSHGFDFVLLSSSNMARAFFGWLDEESARAVRGELKIVSISPVTSEAVRGCGFEPAEEAKTYTMDGMVEALLTHVEREVAATVWSGDHAITGAVDGVQLRPTD